MCKTRKTGELDGSVFDSVFYGPFTDTHLKIQAALSDFG